MAGWGNQLEDLQLRVGREARQVLGSNKDKLPVVHLLGNVNECLNGQLSDLCVEKDIKLIEDTERSLETFAECQEQAHCGVTALSSTVVKQIEKEKR